MKDDVPSRTGAREHRPACSRWRVSRETANEMVEVGLIKDVLVGREVREEFWCLVVELDPNVTVAREGQVPAASHGRVTEACVHNAVAMKLVGLCDGIAPAAEGEENTAEEKPGNKDDQRERPQRLCTRAKLGLSCRYRSR